MKGEISFVEIGGHKARILRGGDGPAVVVLHGWGGRIESMAPVIDCLVPSFSVTAIDLPGFGESPVPAGIWGTADYAEFVSDLCGAEESQRACFLGHSFGGKVSISLAATHDGLVDKLLLVDSAGLTSAPSLKVRLKRGASRTAKVAGRFGSPGRRVRQAVYDRIASQDYRDAGPMQPVLVKVVNEDLSNLMPRIKPPVLLVWGTEDEAVPVTHARKMESLIPDAGLVLFEGAGHFAYLDDPNRFCTIARHFFGARA